MSPFRLTGGQIGVLGIEPRPHAPEACILPLYYTPTMGDTGIEPVTLRM